MDHFSTNKHLKYTNLKSLFKFLLSLSMVLIRMHVGPFSSNLFNQDFMGAFFIVYRLLCSKNTSKIGYTCIKHV